MYKIMYNKFFQTYESMADDVALLIKNLNLRQLQLIGHSMGGNTAALIAAKYPNLIKKVILEEPGFSFSDISPIKKVFYKFAMKIMIPRLLKGSYEELFKKGRKQNPLWSDEELKPWAESKIQFRENNPKLLFKLLNSSYEWKDIVQNISCPLLLITSDKGITSDKLAQRVIEICKDGRWVKIEGAGHNIRREQFGQYIQAIEEFLD